MNKLHKGLACLLTIVLFTTLLLPLQVSAEDIREPGLEDENLTDKASDGQDIPADQDMGDTAVGQEPEPGVNTAGGQEPTFGADPDADQDTAAGADSTGQKTDDVKKADNANQTDDAAGQAKDEDDNTENDTIENDDPGKGRLSGNAPEEFYGEATFGARSSGIVHADKYKDYTIQDGIDVSQWNGTINWAKVKNAGIDFAIVRAAYRGYGQAGTLVADPTAAANLRGAASAGIKVGAYIFSQAITVKEAEAEADFLLKQIKGYDVTLPLVLDFEFASDPYLTGRLYEANLSKTAATNICMAFCKKVAAAGYTPMVYANPDMLNNHLKPSTISASYPVWLAHYTTQTNYAGDYEYWQYSDAGSVNGISGCVDLNVRYVKKNGGSNGGTGNSGTAQTSYTSYKTTDSVNYRSGPGTSYAVKGTLPTGTTISVEDGYSKTANGYTWVRFKKDSQTYYIASAYIKKVTSGSSSAVTLAAPALKSATGDASSITITWGKVAGAEGYYVYRKVSGGSYAKIATVKSGTTVTYTDKTAEAGKTYYYTVKAYKGSTVSAYVTAGISAKRISYTAYQTTDTVNYRSGPGTSYAKKGTLAQGKKINVEDGYSKQAGGYTWYRFTLNSQVYYIASAYLKKAAAVSVDKIAVPTLVSAVNSSGGVTVTWKQASGASGYYIYRKVSGGSYSRIASVSSGKTVVYKDTAVSSGKQYIYTVKGYKGSVQGSYNSKGVGTLYLAAPSLKSVSRSSASVKVTWGKAAGADGYYIYRKISGGNWSKIASVKGNNTVSYTDKKADAGKTYYYTVRAYKGSTLSSYVSAGICAKKITYTQYKTTASVNYRSGPGTSYARKGTLAKGKKISVENGYSKKAGGYTWYRFKLNAKTYYIASQYVKKAGPAYSTYTTTASVNYRSGPGTSYARKGTLAKGKKISVENGYSKKAGGYTWYRFKLNSKLYYIASQYIKK